MIWRMPNLRLLTFMDMIDMLGGSVWVGAFTLAFVQTALGQGEEWWGFINAAYFAGSVGGGLVVLALARAIGSRFLAAMLVGMAGYGILAAVYAINTHPFLALILVLLMGPFAELSVINRLHLDPAKRGQGDAAQSAVGSSFPAEPDLLHFAAGHGRPRRKVRHREPVPVRGRPYLAGDGGWLDRPPGFPCRDNNQS